MRVLFDHQAFTIQSRGGISRYVVELGQQLATLPQTELRLAAGWHRSLLLNENPPDWACGRYLAPWPRTGPLRHAINTRLSQRVVHRWRPDVIHETYFRPGTAYHPDVPTVLTIHDLIYFILPLKGGEADRTRRAQAAAIARADHLICISETTRRDLVRLFPDTVSRTSVIPHGRPASISRPVAPRPLAEPYFLFVGLRQRYKNFDRVLQALAASAHLRTHFNLVAFGDAPFTPADMARLGTLGLDPQRILHRTGDDATLARYYAHASALVFPSLYEGFGMPLLEAMTYGCPVVCSDRGALPEVAGAAALYFDPEAPGELVQALTQLTSDPALAADLRARGHEQSARFSWARCAQETREVYGRVMSARGRDAASI